MYDENLYERSTPQKIYMPMASVVDDKCFVSSSGYGDGYYPYYIYEEEGKVVAIEIVFIGDDEDDETYKDDDE